MRRHPWLLALIQSATLRPHHTGAAVILHKPGTILWNRRTDSFARIRIGQLTEVFSLLGQFGRWIIYGARSGKTKCACVQRARTFFSDGLQPRGKRSGCTSAKKNIEMEEPIPSIAIARDYLHRRFALLSQNLTQQK